MSLVTRPTAELKGPALNWAVAKAIGLTPKLMRNDDRSLFPFPVWVEEQIGTYSPATNWSLGGPLIEKHGIAMRQDKNNVWYAMKSTDLGSGERAQWVEFSYRGGERYGPASYEVRPRRQRFKGETALIAACRAIVASHLGDTVQIPEELT